MGKEWEAAKQRYKKQHLDSWMGPRVEQALMLENEAGPQCAIFTIRLRCVSAQRRNKVFHNA